MEDEPLVDPACPRCLGRGRVSYPSAERTRVELIDGETVNVPLEYEVVCACVFRRRQLSAQGCGIPVRYERMLLETFDPSVLADRAAWADVRARVGALENGALPTHPGYVFYGPNGVGKTHLACALAHKARLAGLRTRFLYEKTFLQAVRDTYALENKGTEADVLARFTAPEVLIYDDLGQGYVRGRISAEFDPTWYSGLVADLLDTRLACPDKMTILTTNLEWGDLPARVGRATTSRMSVLTPILFEGTDRRGVAVEKEER